MNAKHDPRDGDPFICVRWRWLSYTLSCGRRARGGWTDSEFWQRLCMHRLSLIDDAGCETGPRCSG